MNFDENYERLGLSNAENLKIVYISLTLRYLSFRLENNWYPR